MNRIVFPLKVEMKGLSVANLQDGLLFLLTKSAIKMSDAEREAYAKSLRTERASSTYGGNTAKLVAAFQKQQRIQPTGTVDEVTARALNAALEKMGAFDTEVPTQPVTETQTLEQPSVVGGLILRADGKAHGGGLVRAYHVDDRGALRLGEDTTDADGRYTIRYDALPGISAIRLRVAALDASGKTLAETTLSTAAGALEIVNLTVPAPTPATTTYKVGGKVASRTSAGIAGLVVRIMDKSVGAEVLLAQTETDNTGAYQATFTDADLRKLGKEAPDLQARVYAGSTFLAASEIRYNAGARETLHVRLEESATTALRSEFETLAGALLTHTKGRLADLQETEDRQDVTYLANKTGWDARAVAIASLADQFSLRAAQATQSAIDPAYFYALFRAGIPANEDAVYQTDISTVASIWKRAAKQGVIADRGDDLPKALEQFRQVAARRALEGPAPFGLSSMREILALSVGADVAKQQQFADLYTRYRNDTAKFWDTVKQTFGESVQKRLQVDGQLALLTLNNAPLMKKLHEAAGPGGLSSTIDLVEKGLHRADGWAGLIANAPVPQEIPGATTPEKQDRYAELLAAQVRLSFPTATVAVMVKTGETPLATPASRPDVTSFLVQHRDRFVIGTAPVEQYVAKNNVSVSDTVVQEITRIQRVYQITPSDEAMNALLNEGLDSSYAIVRYGRDEFVRTFQEKVGGEAAAQMVHARAQQVHNAVLNVAVSYMAASNAWKLGNAGQILDTSPAGVEAANASDVIAYPTLEGLFGEADYCECEHCRSILSPAAYLVDLLLFIDRPEVPTGYENPQTVLLERRPDLQYLPLTCENTNTPLPYIDLVNETLEYYITNNLSMSGYTGHSNDDDDRAEELLANPQYVSTAAYGIVAGNSNPAPLAPTPPLPFHQPLEHLRRFFSKFEAPLPAVMESLRKDDLLERASDTEYGWRDILMEELRLSRAEYTLLTDRTLSLQELYGFPAGTAEADVMAELVMAKPYTVRMEITYEEIVEILKTRFVNPNADLIPKLEMLGVSFATLLAYHNGTMTADEFDAAISPAADPEKYGGDIKAWVKNDENFARVASLITLTDPTGSGDSCSFDTLEFRYAEGDQVGAFEYVRFYRFIRLWRKLGWSIAETDQVISALYPEDQTPDDDSEAVNLKRLELGFLTLLPRLGIVMRCIAALGLKVKKDLQPLLACFAPINIYGENSLYRQMFLSPAALRQDPTFADDGYGNFLDGTEALNDHLDALRAAFQLTADELTQITQALAFDETTPLTVPNISAIYRRGWLARKLKLSVREFLLLTEHTGYDPFDLADLTDPAVMRLLRLTQRLRNLSLKPATALYLIWNQDLSGKSAPELEEITAFARSLRTDFGTIESQFVLGDDPDGTGTRARMALVYGAEATETFFGLLEQTAVTDVAYTHSAEALEQAILDAAGGTLAYDNLRKRLSYSAGVMPDATRDALQAVAGVTQAFIDAVAALHDKTRDFFDRFPELESHHDTYVASSASDEERRATLLASFLPELEAQVKRQHAIQAVSALVKAADGLTEALLDDETVLHAAADTTRPALDDLVALEQTGLAADAGVYSGYLEAAETGFYNLRVEAAGGATVTLTLDGAEVVLSQSSTVWSNSAPLELTAGTLYPITMTVAGTAETPTLSWETSGRGWETVPERYLYSATLVGRLEEVYVRYLKAASLAQGLDLTADELAYLAASADCQINGEAWLNSLPVSQTPDATLSAQLLTAFDALLDYARIKAELKPGDERLLTILQDPAAATADADGMLYTLARWDAESLQALLTHFGVADVSGLTSLATFSRVYDAYAWVKKLGVAASALIQAAANEPTADTVGALQAALRARYDESDWLGVLKPINDEMRALQRDALVAYVLHQFRSDSATAHIDTAEKLFEYFLMDVQMEPCMQTSRIRHALSSVQLFIDRCLMNLEPRVSPESINATHWQWMSRYRVWEANRKVFLYPENWLEPELRDDQSPFFKEVMSELLQSDITEDTAATALLNYLAKLEEVAKLEPCGIHFVENDEGLADDIAHVVARTAGANRKYYYRRREYGYWTPWEEIKLDIEDNPVLPVVWKNRLFLFWLRLLTEAPMEQPDLPDDSASELSADDLAGSVDSKVRVKAILCWSEYYNGKWQAAKTSDPNRPTSLGSFPMSGSDMFDRSVLQLSAAVADDSGHTLSTDPNGSLVLTVSGPSSYTYFRLYNTHSLPVPMEQDAEFNIIVPFGATRFVDTADQALTMTYNSYRGIIGTSSETVEVLTNNLTDRAVVPQHQLNDPWYAPFFYEDSRHVFYVTSESETVLIGGFGGFFPGNGPIIPEIKIPDLVQVTPKFPIPRPLPDPVGPRLEDTGIRYVDEVPMTRFVTEDAYINRAIGARGTVQFGNVRIGPAGSLPNYRVR